MENVNDWIPYFKAKDNDNGRWVEGFYFAYPETTYCFIEDYQRKPVKMIHCIVNHRMIDWGLSNRPMLTIIDVDTLEQIGWFNTKRKEYGTKPYYEKGEFE